MSNTTDFVGFKNLTLITGGARSGKSNFAELLAKKYNDLPVYYIATMQEDKSDLEGLAKIRRHRERRPGNWQTLEIPLDLNTQIDNLPSSHAICLIDCLTLYIANLLLAKDFHMMKPEHLENKIFALTEELLISIKKRSEIDFLVVTNEVGWGIVPENQLARTYRDITGTINQRFAEAASQVWLSCAGLQIRLKPL